MGLQIGHSEAKIGKGGLYIWDGTLHFFLFNGNM